MSNEITAPIASKPVLTPVKLAWETPCLRIVSASGAAAGVVPAGDFGNNPGS